VTAEGGGGRWDEAPVLCAFSGHIIARFAGRTSVGDAAVGVKWQEERAVLLAASEDEGEDEDGDGDGVDGVDGEEGQDGQDGQDGEECWVRGLVDERPLKEGPDAWWWNPAWALAKKS
jgi:hypothetical protein